MDLPEEARYRVLSFYRTIEPDSAAEAIADHLITNYAKDFTWLQETGGIYTLLSQQFNFVGVGFTPVIEFTVAVAAVVFDSKECNDSEDEFYGKLIEHLKEKRFVYMPGVKKGGTH